MTECWGKKTWIQFKNWKFSCLLIVPQWELEIHNRKHKLTYLCLILLCSNQLCKALTRVLVWGQLVIPEGSLLQGFRKPKLGLGFRVRIRVRFRIRSNESLEYWEVTINIRSHTGCPKNVLRWCKFDSITCVVLVS